MPEPGGFSRKAGRSLARGISRRAGFYYRLAAYKLLPPYGLKPLSLSVAYSPRLKPGVINRIKHLRKLHDINKIVFDARYPMLALVELSSGFKRQLSGEKPESPVCITPGFSPG